jgi:nucleoside-diphosphate-sugar epimerase
MIHASRPNTEVALRMAADAIMVLLSLLSAFVLRLLLLAYLGAQGPFDNFVVFSYALHDSLDMFLRTGGVLLMVCLASFNLSGFYSHTRAYRGRHKGIVVLRAIGLAYLSFGFLSYFLPFVPSLPRSVLIGSCLLTVLSVAGARLWMFAWRRISNTPGENRVKHGDRDDVILVIGGAGYVGSMFSRLLLRQGFSVRVLDLLVYGDAGISGLQNDPRFELVFGDSRNIETLVRCLKEVKAVVHLGEIVGDPACAYDENLTNQVNYAATRMIAEAAKGEGVQRFVYASSCSVYGAGAERLNEKSHLAPLSLYAHAKVSAEDALLKLSDRDFRPTILRFATVYGLSYRMRFDLVVNLLTAKAVSEGTIPIYGGSQWRPFIHVADAARVLLACLDAPLDVIGGKVYNAGSDIQNMQIMEVGRMIERIVPDARLVVMEGQEDKRDYHVSFDKIFRELGFRASKSITDGVQEIAFALRSGKFEDYRRAEFSNYKSFVENAAAEVLRANAMNPIYSGSVASHVAMKQPFP